MSDLNSAMLSGTSSDPSAMTPEQRSAYITSPGINKGQDNLSALLTGGYEGLNQFAFGLPDLALKTFQGENYAKLQNLKKRYKTASDIGGTIGSLGSLLIPGGKIAGLAADAAKGLGATKIAGNIGKISEIAAGKAGGNFARGAAQAAEQAVPRAIIDTAENPEDAGQNATGAGLATLAGGGVGSVIGKAGGLLRHVKSGFGRQMTDQYLGGIGVKGSDIENHLLSQGGGAGHVASQFEPTKIKLAQYASSKRIVDDDSLKAYLAKSHQELAPVANAWDSNPPDAEAIWRSFANSPENVKLLAEKKISPDAFGAIQEAIVDPQNPMKMGNYWDVNTALNRMHSDAKRLFQSDSAQTLGSIDERRTAMQLIDAFRNTVKDYAFERAPDAAQSLRRNWGLHQILQDASVENSKMLQGTQTGSNAGGLSGLSNPALGRALLGAAGGSYLGNQANPGDQFSSIAGGALGAGAAALAPNVIPKALNSLMTRLSSKAIPAGEGAAFTGDVAAKEGPGAIAKLSALIGSLAGHGGPPPAIPPIAQGPAPAGTPGSPIQSLPVGVHGSSAPISMGGENVQPHGQVKLPGGGFQSGAGQRILDNLNRIYNTYEPTDNGRKLTKQEFFDQVQGLTGGFDPTNQTTLRILTNDQAERGQLASSIPRLSLLTDPGQINLDALVDRGRNLFGGGNFFDAEAKRANNSFVELAAKLNATDPNAPADPKEIKQIQDQVNNIREDMSLSDTQKKQQLMDLLVGRGFTLAKLESLGLTQGTQLEGLR